MDPRKVKARFGIGVMCLVVLSMLLALTSYPADAAVTRFLVVDTSPLCDRTMISTDVNCWSATSGGVGGVSVPVAGDTAIADILTGGFFTTVSLNANLHVGSFTLDGFAGILALANNVLTTDGNFHWAGGRGLTSSTSLAAGGAGRFIIGGHFNVTALANPIFLGSGTLHLIGGNWDTTLQDVTVETSNVTFTGSGTIRASTSATNFYNIQVNAATTRTSLVDGLRITNVMTVLGAYRAGIPNNPQLATKIFGQFDASGRSLRLGPATDLTLSGKIQLIGERTLNHVPAATYQHLNILTDGNRVSVLDGNIATAPCGVMSDCPILISGWSPGDNITFYSNSHSITASGELWVGDLATRHAVARFNASSVTARGFDTLANSISFMGTGVWTLANPLTCADTLVAFSTEFHGIVHAQSATVTVTGCAFLNVGATTQWVFGENSTWRVSGDAGCRGPNDHFIPGNSRWDIGGNWVTDGSPECARPAVLPPQFSSCSTFDAGFPGLTALLLIFIAVGFLFFILISLGLFGAKSGGKVASGGGGGPGLSASAWVQIVIGVIVAVVFTAVAFTAVTSSIC